MYGDFRFLNSLVSMVHTKIFQRCKGHNKGHIKGHNKGHNKGYKGYSPFKR